MHHPALREGPAISNPSYTRRATPGRSTHAQGGQLMEYRVLGPLEVLDTGGPLPLGGGKQRTLLALLILNANQVVPRERLIDELWGDEAPETAVKVVQVY